MTKPDRKAAARAIEEFLRAIGRDVEHDANLAGTGERVANAYIDELCDGYAVDVAALLTESRIAGSSELVSVRGVAVTTMCPHHLLPAEGEATVVFAPRNFLVGIGTLVKLVDAFAHRLTLQEVIGEQVASALVTHLDAKWAGCRLNLSHACVCARGERRHGTRVESLAFQGDVSPTERTFVYQAMGVGG
jgi:GTP cyclohydrolase I